jgi:hypothetical protein
MAEALACELVEEGNIEILEPPVLHGLFFNGRVSQRDHVALFIVRSFRQQRVPVRNREIAAHGFFLSTLPENTTPGDAGGNRHPLRQSVQVPWRRRAALHSGIERLARTYQGAGEPAASLSSGLGARIS